MTHAHFAACLTLVLICAGCSERDKMATIDAEGLVDRGQKLGVPIGATISTAQKTLTAQGFQAASVERGGSCNSPRRFAADYTAFFMDMTWRKGTVCIGVTRGRVSHIAWLYNPLSP